MFRIHSNKPLATLVANPVVFPGSRDDAGKIQMGLELVFENGEDAKAFLVKNHLPTVVFDRKR